EDSEQADRCRAVDDTAVNLDRGIPVSGWPTVADQIGEGPARKIAEWLGVEFPALDRGGIVPTLFDLGSLPELYTDLGNAKRFHNQNRDGCFYHSNLGKWFIWDGNRWAASAAGAVERLGHLT